MHVFPFFLFVLFGQVQNENDLEPSPFEGGSTTRFLRARRAMKRFFTLGLFVGVALGSKAQDAPLQSLVSGKRVFAVSSPRFITVGRIRRMDWSPSDSSVAISFAPVIETPIAEASRLKKGEVRKGDTLASLLIYTLETGKTVRVVTAWDTNEEHDERIGWIDEATLLIATTPRKPTAGERIRYYVVDAGSGAVVNSFQTQFGPGGSSPCLTPSKGGSSQVVLFDVSSGGPEPKAYLYGLTRAGLSGPFLTGRSIGGGIESADGSGIIWSVDGNPALYRLVNGRLESSPVTEEDLKSADDRRKRLSHDDEFRTGEPQLSIKRLPAEITRLSLRVSISAPLQPDEMLIGVGSRVVANIGAKGLVYELDGVLLGRFMTELAGQSAERAMDLAERTLMDRWARIVVSEYRSWTYGFSEPPDPTKFPVAQMGSFRDFASRLSWLGAKGRRFEIRGERILASYDESGIGTYSPLPRKG